MAAVQTRTLNLELRTARKKGGARKLRRAGKVPGIVYGAGEENVMVQVDRKDVEKLVRELHGEVVILDLNIDGQVRQGLIKDVQFHPVTGDVLHVDFQIVHAGEEVEVTVPVVVVGEAPGVKAGGTLELLLHEMDIRAPADRIPPHIEVDVSTLGLGDVLHVRDLSPPEGTVFLEDPDEPVVAIHAPRAAAEEAGEEEVPEAGAGEGGAQEEA